MISSKKFLFWGQITNLRSFRVKFQTSRKLGKLYIKMKLLSSAFQKSWFRGHPRSPEVKNREKRVKFEYFSKVGKLYLKMKLVTSAFQKSEFQGKKGHQRSKIAKKTAEKVKFLAFLK